MTVNLDVRSIGLSLTALGLVGLLTACAEDLAAPHDTSPPPAHVNLGAADDLVPESDDPIPAAVVPEFGRAEGRSFTLVGTASDGLARPRDLAFNPQRPDELWTVNQATDGTVTYFSPGTPEQRVDARVDRFANHFMEEVSSLAFGADDTFGTCQETRNTYDHQALPNDHMGPTLWPSDLDIYARINQDPDSELLGSHLDMLHQSPLCMGIEHHAGNAYWVFDGYHGDLVYYDFQHHHGPGGHDHADGIVRHYVEVELHRVENVPGHLALDRGTGWLYIADTGGGRVLRVDTGTGYRYGYLQPRNEPLAELSVVLGVGVEAFVTEGLQQPSGLALGERLFVGDHATGEIVAFDRDGRELGRLQTQAEELMGLALGPDGHLWYVDGGANELWRVDPVAAPVE